MTRIRIVGAGIAGLTTALAIHRVGLRDVKVYEQAATLKPLGSGLNLMPQATSHLETLGVLSDLEEVGIATRAMQLATHRGQLIWEELRGRAAGGEHPQLSIHRGWLTSILADHVRERLGPDAIRTGAKLSEVDEIGQVARFETPEGARLSSGFDLLVGADGIRSRTRDVVVGAPTPLHYAGATIWRGVVRAPSFLDGATMVIAGDGRCKVVFYPLEMHSDGMCLLNWAAATPHKSADEQGNWNATVDSGVFAESFAGWQVHGVDVHQAMLSTAQPFAYPMVDIDPLASWTRGNVTLAGDAAHAMYPIGSNGATQSVIDAAVLGQCLGACADPSQAARSYEAVRRGAVSAVQRANRQRGPEAVIDLAALRAPQGFTDVAQVFALGELEQIAVQYALTSGAPVPVRSM